MHLAELPLEPQLGKALLVNPKSETLNSELLILNPRH